MDGARAAQNVGVVSKNDPEISTGPCDTLESPVIKRQKPDLATVKHAIKIVTSLPGPNGQRAPRIVTVALESARNL